MTDLDMIKACADATGIALQHGESVTGRKWWYIAHSCIEYNPLEDDKQAMAVLKTMLLDVSAWPDRFEVWNGRASAEAADLNRAIVECVWKHQASLSAAGGGS